MSTQDIKDLSATMQQLQQQWGEVLPKIRRGSNSKDMLRDARKHFGTRKCNAYKGK